LEKLLQIDVEIKHSEKGYSRNDPNQEMARKLDWLLLIFLDYLDYIFQINDRNKENCFGTIKERPSSEKEAEANLEKHLDNFFELLDIFQGNLLVTYQSKYVQYIFFYLCSYTEIYPEIMQHFLSRLITNIRTEEETKFVRVNSVHYLRSIMVRAKYIPFQILSKSMGYLIDYLKGYSRISRKKAAKFDPEKESLHFEKIELSASSKYRERLSENSAKQQESEYKQLFQKYDIFYYTAYAVAYIFSNNIEKFVSNNQYEDYNTFVAILLKYNSLFKTLKFVPKNLLSHFKEIHEKLQGTEQLTTLLNAELNMEEEFQESEFRGDVFLEEYLPFDTNFLNMTKKLFYQDFTSLRMKKRKIKA